MTPEQTIQMIDEWGVKSTKEFAQEFGVSVRTVQRWAKSIREQRPGFCPKTNTETKIVTIEQLADRFKRNYIKKYGRKKFY